MTGSRERGDLGRASRPAVGPRQATEVSSMNGGDVAPELDQEFDPGTLHMLRAKVLVQACRAGLSESRAADVVLAVHELAANAIRHGAGAGRLRVWNLGRELCCQGDDGAPPQSDDRGWNSAGSATSAADGHRQTLASSMSGTPGHGLWLRRAGGGRGGKASPPAGAPRGGC